jgi:hypothetical protein
MKDSRKVRLVDAYFFEKMDMDPQKGIDEDFRYKKGETCIRVFCAT